MDGGHEAAGKLDPGIWRVAAVAVIGPFMTQLDATVVNVSLPAIRRSLDASTGAAQWIISGYLLALALMLPLSGWLVDRLGAKRLYLWCFSTFTLASIFCGAARTMDELILARLAQGMAGGLLAPMAQMMMARAAGPHLARVMGYTVVPVLIAPVLGPVVAGAVLKHASWPWLFYLNLPMGVLGVVLATLLLRRDEEVTRKRAFDLRGFVLISPGLVCLLYGLQHAAQPVGASALLAGALLAGAFVRHAMREGGAALVDVRLFDSRVFSTSAATQFLSNGAFFGRQFLIPFYLITGCALSAFHAGWMMACMGVGMMSSFPLMGFLTDRFGCRTVSSGGALLATLGMLPFVWMSRNGFSPLLTPVALFAMGAGQGTISIPSMSAAYASVPKEKLAVATTAINMVQRLGGPLATTLTAIVVSMSGSDHAVGGARSFTTGFAFLTGVGLLTLLMARRLPVRIARQPRTGTA